MKTEKTLIVGLGALLVLGFSMVPSGAVHITGNQVDLLASTLNATPGENITNNEWWAGDTVLIPHPAPGEIDDITLRDAFDELSEDCEDFFSPEECDTVLVTDFSDPIFALGIVICERNTLPAAAGWGGRCFSHRYEKETDDNDDEIKKSKINKTHVKSLNKTHWWRMQVTPDDNAAPDCGSEPDPAKNLDPNKRRIGYFARMGNNDHGIEVKAGNDFAYRPKLAQILDDNHITYFINADEVGLLPLQCWGQDWHSDIDPPELGPSHPNNACNNIKDEDYDAFDPDTYDREGNDDGDVDQSEDRWNTVCTVKSPH